MYLHSYTIIIQQYVCDFSLVLYLHTRLDVRRCTAAVNFRNCSYTNCQMATNVQNIRQLILYTRAILQKDCHNVDNVIRENDLSSYA